jgi:predicted N-acetyltransferase YhbS
VADAVPIRCADPNDIAGIAKLLRDLPGVWQDRWRSDVLERAIASANGLAFVAEHAGTVVGFVCAHDVGFRAYLSELAVAIPWQRRGLGKALVAVVTKELAGRGCSILVADICPPAVAFYERMGWYTPDAVLLAFKADAV